MVLGVGPAVVLALRGTGLLVYLRWTLPLPLPVQQKPQAPMPQPSMLQQVHLSQLMLKAQLMRHQSLCSCVLHRPSLWKQRRR